MLQFFVRDDVFHDGRDECGHPVERLAYYVVAEEPSGRRWAHSRVFTDEGVWKRGEKNSAEMLARIERAYAAGRPLDPAHWEEIDPAYGSDAYQGLDGECYFRNREIMEAHEAGEISELEASRLMMR